MTLDDESAGLHLSAGTSQERVGVDVVLVHRAPGSDLVTALEGGEALDLADPSGGDEQAVDRLRSSLLRLDAAEDVPDAVIVALLRSLVPPLFQASPWLRHARPVVLESGVTHIAGTRLGYQAGTGLWVETEETTPS
ncbi:hypothetical protein ACKI1I_42845 [Streptomyces turgidiscabies]|uniref:hypothetical protein n=1 Tax=Streptomyces turgidiscabies TaxID=85558 RepID=UPI0038F7E811